MGGGVCGNDNTHVVAWTPHLHYEGPVECHCMCQAMHHMVQLAAKAAGLIQVAVQPAGC
jgi:hypothetical protein